MTSISYATAVDPRTLPFEDRRTSLKVVGVLLLVFGGLCGCFAALMPVGMYFTALAARQAPPGSLQAAAESRPDVPTMVVAGGTYALFAAAMVWVGVGAVRLRRWARPVVLVAGWTWLATGVATFAHWALFGASMREMMTAGSPPGAPQPPREVVYAVTALAGALTFVTMIILPALLVWVFRRRGVRETLTYFDARPAWTDRCPTPVLAVAAWLVLAAAGTAAYSAYAVLPVFGRFVKGPAAVAALLATAAVFLWLAWGVYRLKPVAWWATAVLWTLWAGSMVWTFTSTGYHEFYRQAGYSPREIDMMMRYSGQFEDGTVWMLALWSVALIGYLLYVRRHFAAAPPPPDAPVDAPPGAPDAAGLAAGPQAAPPVAPGAG